MIEISLAEAEQHMPELLAKAIHGEQISIMQAGHTIVRMLPANDPSSMQRDAEEAIARIESRSDTLSGSFTWDNLKRDRDAGLR